MRVILDTNVLLSALLVRGSAPDQLYRFWLAGRFDLATCSRQLEELREVSRRPFFRARIKPSEAGRLVNQLRRLAVYVDPLPDVSASPDPNDDFLLALAQAADADLLVSGDKSDLLALHRTGCTRIVTARQLVDTLSR
ncbi:putative toxin-antitoxin system toxin component, PIN family [Thiohalocapsa halophila]|uniref:Toxin-antitoxin system toxin component, PIN family n=1 Tax=Thiohalocapsa halophila TaxID=69359 RepID=A0ABS1CK82_9GAMM|nr:putative toxin-antitoxin system toxin component, PIN family [Thiohalocapsa halophila]MBK1632341.1 putative toxin-antitoxin system toxin component, PIN family [Thiohalocapsa halophila]